MASSSGRGGIVQDTLSPTEMPNTVAAPIDTYQAVTKSQSPGAQFLEGLGKLAEPATKAITNFDQAAGDKAEADANLKALTATPDELRAEIASGNFYGLAHRRAQSALRVMDASNRAFDVASQLDGMNQRGELQGPDAQAKLAMVVGQHADAVAGDPLAEKQFTNGVMPVMRKFTTDILRNNVQAAEVNKAAKLYSYLVAQHDAVDRDAADNPTDPDTLATLHRQALFRAATFAKNDLLMGPKAIKDVVGKVAEHYSAAGNLPAFDTLGRYDRDGAPLADQYGPQWDAWRTTAEKISDAAKKRAANSDADGLTAQAIRGGMTPADFDKAVDAASAKDPENFGQARAEQLKAQFSQNAAIKVKQAQAALSEQQEAQFKRDYTDSAASFLRVGNGYMIPEVQKFTTADGKEHTVKRSDALQDGYRQSEVLIDEQGKNEGWTPEDVLRAKAKLYSQNGDVHPIFQQSFSDLFAGSRAGVPANPETLPQRLQQLDFLRTNDPNQYANLADAGGKDGKNRETWLTAYRVAREDGADAQRAYAIANQRVFSPQANERLSNTALAAKTDDTLTKLTAQGWFSSGPGILAGPIARRKAAEAVELQVAAGTADKDIAEKATEALLRSNIVVNGIPVRGIIPGVGNPAVAAEYLKDAATFFKQQSPSLRNAPFGLALADDPAHPGAAYIVVRTDTSEAVSRKPIMANDLRDYVLQWREINARQAKAARDAGDPTAIPESERSGTEARSAGIKTRMKLEEQRRKGMLPAATTEGN